MTSDKRDKNPDAGDVGRLRIGVITDPKHAYGRNIVRGAIEYLEEHEASIVADVLPPERQIPLSQFKDYDGFLEATPEPRLAQLEGGKPIVTVDNPDLKYALLSMPMDNHAIGKAAAVALHARGVESYGYYDGSRGSNPRVDRRSRERLAGFREGLEELGVENVDSQVQIHAPSTAGECREWLGGLAKPAGVFGFNDLGCHDVAEGCRLLNLIVPQEVAIIGVDNDQLLCSLSQPPHSSIDPGTRELAFNATKVLVQALTSGEGSLAIPDAPVPKLCARESTGESSVRNDTVRKALAVISSNIFTSRLSAVEVASKSGVSLRVLEELFKEHLGRTIRAEILQKQLEQFKYLLRTTDLTVETISERMSVESTSLRRSFIRIEGIRPGAYRRTYRASRGARSKSVVRVRPALIDICMLNEFQGQSAFDYLRGAQDYTRQFHDVHLSIRTVGFDEAEGKLLPSGSPELLHHDGFIAPPPMALPADAIGRKPVVYLDHQRHHKLSWSVADDNRELGVMAARHFLAKGHQSFVYCDHPGREDSNTEERTDQRTSDRHRGFHETLVDAGMTQGALFREVLLGDEKPPDWLSGLPRPTAVFAFNDTVALSLIDHCRSLGLRVPEDVAILGTDNDELLCNLIRPSLSSIEVGFRRAGFVAMRTVVEAIRGGSESSGGVISLQPNYIVERESSAGPASDDPVIVTAMEFISRNYPESLRVGAIAEVCGVSRRTLESRFQNVLETTVANHLQAVRMDAAKAQLAGSMRPIGEVAEMTGFQHARHFSQVFRGQTGMTPRAFRVERGLKG